MSRSKILDMQWSREAIKNKNTRTPCKIAAFESESLMVSIVVWGRVGWVGRWQGGVWFMAGGAKARSSCGGSQTVEMKLSGHSVMTCVASGLRNRFWSSRKTKVLIQNACLGGVTSVWWDYYFFFYIIICFTVHMSDTIRWLNLNVWAACVDRNGTLI